jgi:hypothetical protein
MKPRFYLHLVYHNLNVKYHGTATAIRVIR